VHKHKSKSIQVIPANAGIQMKTGLTGSFQGRS
jgi:hypothetical protein